MAYHRIIYLPISDWSDSTNPYIFSMSTASKILIIFRFLFLFFQLNPFFQSKLPFIYNIQLGLHGWAIVLTLLVFGTASLGVRSAYIFIFPLTFYTFALVLNMLTTLHDRGYSWAGTVTTFQIMPFLYSSYIIYTFIVAMTPMTGRSGSASNPDTLIAGMAALGTLLSFGFLVSYGT